MGSVDVPDELCGELGEFDGLLEGELERVFEDNETTEQEIQQSIQILTKQTQLSTDPTCPSAPKDRIAAFKRPLHLLSPHCDREFVIFGALTQSCHRIFDDGWDVKDEEPSFCSTPSSPTALPAKHILAMNSKEGSDGGCGGSLLVPGLHISVESCFESPWTSHVFSDALSMFCSATGRSPQTFYAALQWSMVFNTNSKKITRIHEDLKANWNSDDYFDPGPITRPEQFLNPLEYILRGNGEPFTIGSPPPKASDEDEKEEFHPPLLRFRRALDGKLAKAGLKELDDEVYDIALWEYWNDYGNMHVVALRSLFPITGAYRLRDSFLSAFTSKGDDKRLPTSSTSKFESLPVEVLLQVFSNSRITPPDLLSMGGTSERLRSILTEGRRVDSLTKDFIERSAPWLLPNSTDWWDCGGYEDYDNTEFGEDQEFFEWKVSVAEHRRGERLRIQRKRKRESTEQRIWREWVQEAEVEAGLSFEDQEDTSKTYLPSNFPWLAYYLVSTSTRRTRFGRETNYAYSSSMRNRKRVHHIVKNIEKLIEEVGVDPEKPLNMDSVEAYRKMSEEGKERFKSWPEGTPRGDFAQFLTY